MAELGTIDAKSRRWMAAEARRFTCQGAAMYGASLPTRTVITLLLRALELFRPHGVKINFTKTEQEARAWIDEQRRGLAK